MKKQEKQKLEDLKKSFYRMSVQFLFQVDSRIPGMRDRDKEIFTEYLMGKTAQEISEKFSLSESRIYQVLQTFLKYLEERIESFEFFLNSYGNNSPRELEKMIRDLEAEKAISNFGPTEKLSTHQRLIFGHVLALKIDEKIFSVRSVNCLHAAGIYTLGDMLWFCTDITDKSEEGVEKYFLRIRGLGSQSMKEIKAFMVLNNPKIKPFGFEFFKN